MLRRARRNGLNAAAAAVLLALTANVVLASAGPRPPEEIEEVQIIAARLKLAELRAEIVRTEDEFYKHLNELLGDPEMSVACENGPPIGSRIHRRSCGPQFVATANATYAREMIQGLALASATMGGFFMPPPSPGATIASNEVVFRRKVGELMEKDATLRELAQRRASLEILLKAAQKARFRPEKNGARD